MSKSQWVRYVLVLSVLLLLRAADLVITFIYTPDFGMEWNPVVSRFSAAWTGMILTQILILSVIAVLLYFYFTYQRTPIPAGLSYNDFVYMYFFGKLNKGIKKLFSIPRNWRGVLALNGFVLASVAIWISAFAVAHNSLMMYKPGTYGAFVNRHYNAYFPAVFLGMAAIATYGFLFREYRRYKKGEPG